MTPRFHKLRIASIRPETADAVCVELAVPPALASDFAFVQGQHLTLKTSVDGQEMRRSYSICSGVDDGLLRVLIKKVPGGRFSVWAHARLRSGDEIEVLTPDGRFHTPLDPSHAKHYVAFAAGSGITPILSLISTTLRREPRSRFTLVYGNRRQSSILFQEELEDLKDRYLTRFALYHVFSREQQDAPLFNGRLDRTKVRAFSDSLVPTATIDEAFVCGPGAMIDEVSNALLECGVATERIHVERFGVPDADPSHHVEADDAPNAIVTVISDGIQREIEFRNSDPSILDAALAAGVDLPFACKGGVCCTCRAKVLNGRVRMDKNYGLERRELDAGYVLTCQSHPLTERVTISYDAR
jgi:ring-1,2-phenylacetyl-CoA epoxidase subunit PaaE